MICLAFPFGLNHLHNPPRLTCIGIKSSRTAARPKRTNRARAAMQTRRCLAHRIDGSATLHRSAGRCCCGRGRLRPLIRLVGRQSHSGGTRCFAWSAARLSRWGRTRRWILCVRCESWFRRCVRRFASKYAGFGVRVAESCLVTYSWVCVQNTKEKNRQKKKKRIQIQSQMINIYIITSPTRPS